MDSDCIFLVVLGIYWMISLIAQVFVRMFYFLHTQKVCEPFEEGWRGSREVVSAQGLPGVSADRTRPEKEKKSEKETPPPRSPLSFIVISLTILRVGRNRCGSASAALRSALCLSALELWGSLAPAAHRFSRDPERCLPPAVDKFLSPHFPRNFPRKNRPSQSSFTSSFPWPRTSSQEIMRKSDPCERKSVKTKWGPGWTDEGQRELTRFTLTYRLIGIIR